MGPVNNHLLDEQQILLHQDGTKRVPVSENSIVERLRLSGCELVGGLSNSKKRKYEFKKKLIFYRDWRSSVCIF